MGLGLFGKLPAKRDFIAFNVSRRFLDGFEPWLQNGLAASKLALGAGWGEAYNHAPLWRFWLGADICGEPVIGAWTPSVDGVGRAFPLILMATGDEGALAPPELEPQADWFEAAETKLLEALEPGVDFEAYTRSLASLPPPKGQEDATEIGGLTPLDEGGALARDMGDQVSLAFRAARRFDHRHAFAGDSYWWTIGGEGFPPLALALRGLPSSARFADFLTGVFAPQAGAPE
jgi:type VI secretion system protein ImpM